MRMSPTPGLPLHHGDDRHGKPRNAHQAAFIISNVSLPNLRAPANMQRLCPADHVPARHGADVIGVDLEADGRRDRKSTCLNSSHVAISYAVFCLKKKTQT